MTSPFDAAMRVADISIAATFGELILVTPRLPFARHAPVMDIDREETAVRGVFTLVGGVERLTAQIGKQFQGMLFLADAEALVWFPEVSMEQLGFDFHKDDEISLIEREGKPRYSVVQDYPSSQRDVVLHLALLTGP